MRHLPAPTIWPNVLALGATLAGRPTEVAYPEMPVELKTPACPLVISSSIPVAA